MLVHGFEHETCGRASQRMQLPNSSYCDPIFDLAVNTVAVLACKLMQLPSRPPYMHTCCCSVSVLVGERGGKRMEYREGKGGGEGTAVRGEDASSMPMPPEQLHAHGS